MSAAGAKPEVSRRRRPRRVRAPRPPADQQSEQRPRMPGNLTFERLKKNVESGDIDTVLVCQIDMQGRLMGKRFHARHFIDSGHQETHRSTISSRPTWTETVPAIRRPAGRPAMATARPSRTWRRSGTSRGWRRRRWSSATVHDRHTRGRSRMPRGAVRKRQVERLKDMGLAAMIARKSILPLQPSSRAARAAGYRGMSPPAPTTRTTTSSRRPRKRMSCGPCERSLRRRRAGRCTKGEASAGQEEINVLYAEALEMRGQPFARQKRHQEIAWSKGKAQLHGQVGLRPGRQLVACPPVAEASTAGQPSTTRRVLTACRT